MEEVEIKRIREACENGHLEYLRKNKMHLLRKDEDGYYPIHHAIRAKQIKVVEFLFNKQKICKTSKGLSCLMLAIASENRELIVMFLDQVKIVDKRKRGVIYYLLNTNNPDLFKFVIRYIESSDLPNPNILIEYCIKEHKYKSLEAFIEYLNNIKCIYNIGFLDRISDIVMIIEKKIRKSVIKNYRVVDYGELYNNGNEDSVYENDGTIIQYHSQLGNIPDALSTKAAKYYKKFLYYGKISEFEIENEDVWKTIALEILNVTKSNKFIDYLMTIIAYKRYFDLDIFHVLLMNENLSTTAYKILIKKGINSMKFYNTFKPEDVLRILHLLNTKPICEDE